MTESAADINPAVMPSADHYLRSQYSRPERAQGGTMNTDQLAYLLAFNCIAKLKSFGVSRILDYYGGDAASAWRTCDRWAQIALLPPGQEAEIRAMHSRISPDRLLTEYLASGANITVLGEDDYPPALAEIYDPPLLLFYHGRLPQPDELCLALIGSRHASPYGRQVAEIFARDLAAQGAVIVSGMARGIDSICHQGALDAEGRTLAVLGSGLDVIYPRENERLYAQICAQGAVVSEFPLGMAALSINFPRRNRIISGFSRGVVVIEAGEKSGTLRTVDYALEQGRDVFAVPGPVTSALSRGTNRLLKQGAKIALSAADIWGEYSDQPLRRVSAAGPGGESGGLSRGERLLLELLQTPQQFDFLASRQELGLSTAELSARLSMLEIRGLIRQLPGKYYQAVVKNIRA